MSGPSTASAQRRAPPEPGRRPRRLVVAVTSWLSADILLRGQLAHLRQAGFDVWLLCEEDPRVAEVAAREGATLVSLPFRREIDLRHDARALAMAVTALRRIRPDVVLASTPKAGLISTTAARLAGVRRRIYLVRGLRLETARGPRRLLLSATERLAMSAATEVLAVSHSLRERIGELGLCDRERVQVLGRGSSRGVDIERFDAARPQVPALRERLGISEDSKVVGFVGRLTRDKGVVELVQAFRPIAERDPKVRLLMVGEPEPGDPVPTEILEWLHESAQVVLTGHVEGPAPYYHLMSVLAFPSHREGFPNAPLEAAACSVPVAGFRVTGTVDAVADGETGTLVALGDVQGLEGALMAYIANRELREQHGAQARRRAEAEFSEVVVLEHLTRYLMSV